MSLEISLVTRARRLPSRLDRLGYLWSGFPRLDLWRLGERIDGSFAVGSVGWWPRGPMMPRIHTPLFSNLQEKVHVNFGFLLSV